MKGIFSQFLVKIYVCCELNKIQFLGGEVTYMICDITNSQEANSGLRFKNMMGMFKSHFIIVG